MSIAAKMAAAAVECARTPGRFSVWSERLGKYVCSADPGFDEAMAERSAARAPIGSAFKLVFLTAAGGTLLFTAICVGTSLYVGKDMASYTGLPETIKVLITMAQIGFGTVAGLLGGQTLKA